ncbi:hypothetical protein JW968_01745 [Candidatus Woesearchaeota archaeon]|nr:hypothetical protein [Candidatus Woesearchaeota archaeon]
METHHIFVPLVDIEEMLPFTFRSYENLEESMQEQERSRQELMKFIGVLEQRFNKKILYLGFDEIAGRFYERFIFEEGGFFEIMIEAPVAMNAHFFQEEHAKTFAEALRQTLYETLPDTPIKEMFLQSIEVQSEDDISLTYKKWETLKSIKKGKEG